jgi:hypothetical protein
MPEVMVGWCARCGAHWGGNLERKILYLGAAGLDTPIWDVLTLQGEQEWALNHLTMHTRSPAFQIRQAVPVQLARAAGLGLRLSQLKMYITVDTMFLHIIYRFL